MASWSRSIQDIVERQVSSWEAERRRTREVQAREEEDWPRVGEGPWLTISRQPGTDAHEIGHALAERLGWSFFDRELLSEIAARIEIPEAFLERFDEHSVGLLDDFLVRPAMPGDPGQLRFLLGQMTVIRQLGRRGKVVIVGRGANWILDPRYGVRVRLIAQREDRVSEIARKRGLDDVREAEHIVRDLDTQQRRYIEQVFGKDVADPSGYDVVLNVSGLGRDVAVEVIMALVRGKAQLSEQRARAAVELP